jgi:hypothetical protein
MCCFHGVTTKAEEIIDRTEGGEKALRLSRGVKSPPLAFTLAGRLMGVLGPLVLPLIMVVTHIRHHFFARGIITP